MYDSTETVMPMIDSVIDHYKNMVYRLALIQTRNLTDTKDIFQEVFLNYVIYIESKKDSNAFTTQALEKTWMLKTTIDCVLKRSKINPTFKSTIEPDFLTKLPASDANIYRAVWKLPLKYRLIIHLFYYEEMKIGEISSLLCKKDTVVRDQLMKAIRLLKKILKGDYDYV